MYSRHEVQVTISSAKHLKNVNWRHGDIRPYAVVWVDPSNKFTTRVADGDTSPFWDERLVIQLTAPVDDSILHIDIVHANPEEDTKPLIGSARLSLSEVFDDVGFNEPLEKTLRLRRPSGRPQGKLEVKVVLSEHRYHAPEPYAPDPYYVPPPPPPYYAHPPPPPPYGQPGYATVTHTTHVHHEEHRRNNRGLGAMAVGAAAGLLGGLAIAEGVEELLDD
ncbi:C2 domain [Dillenia turbinata]|uniref:C2 domain n=1 Tax=Dillenia turbinata TaxID=194707 RepID=A0AAN8ZJT7_9MAGN